MIDLFGLFESFVLFGSFRVVGLCLLELCWVELWLFELCLFVVVWAVCVVCLSCVLVWVVPRLSCLRGSRVSVLRSLDLLLTWAPA